MEMDGKVAVATGAGSGIGRATGMALASRGARVVLNDVVPGYLEDLARDIPADTAATVAGDISDEETSRQLVATALERFGRLDILVANAGVMFFKDITDVTVAEFDELMAVNVRGMFLACKHAIPVMLAQRSGAIVIVTSVSAYRGQEFGGTSTFAYNMTKAAVRQLATSLASRYAKDGIRVNAIAPGVTRTRQIRHYLPDLGEEEEEQIFLGVQQIVPLGRVAAAEEIAEAIVFLASDRASYVSGTTLFADGGIASRL